MIVWKMGQPGIDRPATVRIRWYGRGSDRRKTLSFSTGAAALLRIQQADEVVIITDMGLITAAPAPLVGSQGFTVTTNGRSVARICCTTIPDEYLPEGTFELRQTRLGWAWGTDRAERPETIEEAAEAIIALPPWRPSADQDKWIENLEGQAS